MIKKNPSLLVVLAAVLILAAYNSVFIVDQTQRAIVVQFGEPISPAPLAPGLHFKIPFIQEALFFDIRLMDHESAPAEMLTRDQKTLVVDAFMRWRVTDPLLFYQSFKAADLRSNINDEAKRRLGGVLSNELRRLLSVHDMSDIIFHKRAQIMDAITKTSHQSAKEWGVEIIDVRIKGVELPVANQAPVFKRMIQERQEMANRYRSTGEGERQQIMAEADLELAATISKAEMDALEIRGKADADAARIYAEAYSQDQEFYAFLRSLESYRHALSDKTTIVLSPSNNDYLNYFGRSDIMRPPASR